MNKFGSSTNNLSVLDLSIKSEIEIRDEPLDYSEEYHCPENDLNSTSVKQQEETSGTYVRTLTLINPYEMKMEVCHKDIVEEVHEANIQDCHEAIIGVHEGIIDKDNHEKNFTRVKNDLNQGKETVSETCSSTSNCRRLFKIATQPKRKQKRSDKKWRVRKFQESWTERFGMIEKDNRALCTLCSETVVCRTYSVRRHYETVHKLHSNKSEEKQKEYISQELSKRKIQSDALPKLVSNSPNLVCASFEISKVIAEHGKPLTDGEYIKEAWLESAPFLFDDFSEKEKIIQCIKDLPMSSKTIKDRIIKLGKNRAEQLTKDLASCKFFSICLDESTDVTASARLAIIARFCRGDEVCEELVNVVTMPQHSTGAEICMAVINELSSRHVEISKVVSVTTDGAPNMIERDAGFVNLFAKHVNHPLIDFHCIVHEEALCTKPVLIELEHVMQAVTKVVNFICLRGLKMRQFQNLLNEVQSMYQGLIMYNDVRWLSRGSVLNRFVECLDEINLFLVDQKFSCKEISDIFWICKLMFFTDFCSHLNDLNAKLQGYGKTVDVMFDNLKAFNIKLAVYERDIDSGKFRYFPNLKRYITQLEGNEKSDCQDLRMLWLYIIDLAIEQFSIRFVKFRELEETVKFIKFPDSVKLSELNLKMFQWIDLGDFEMQLTDFQSSSIWKQKFIDLRTGLENIERERLATGLIKKSADNELLKVWNSIPDTFICLKNLAEALLTIFSSTYLCESLFSAMNVVKSTYRTRLTDETSAACIALKVIKSKHDIKYLSSKMQQQKSH